MFSTAVRTVPIALAAAVALAAGPARAADRDAPRSVEVRHGDLDLTRAHDVARLNHRIAAAARTACGSVDIRDLRATADNQKCRDDAIAAAAPKVELAVARANGAGRLAGAPAPAAILIP